MTKPRTLQQNGADPLLLVGAHISPQKRAYQTCQKYYYHKVLNLSPCDKEHREQYWHHEHDGSEVGLEENKGHCQECQCERSDKSSELPIVFLESQIPCKCEDVRDLAELGGLDLQEIFSYTYSNPSAGSVYNRNEWDVNCPSEQQDGQCNENGSVYPVTGRSEPAVIYEVGNYKSEHSEKCEDDLFFPCSGKIPRPVLVRSLLGIARGVDGGDADSDKGEHRGEHDHPDRGQTSCQKSCQSSHLRT